MPDTRSPKVSAFFRFYFQWSDPLILLYSSYMYFFTPDIVVNAYIPASIAPRNPYYDFLLQQVGGALLMLAFLTFVLLRSTDDIKVWKIVEASILIYDFTLLYCSYDALSQQGRLSIEAMRAEDWGSIGITSQAIVIRTLFLLGVGVSAGDRVVKKA